jgi:acetylglutamate kinase
LSYKADQVVAVRALKNAAPYIRMFKGKVFVIKAGGAVFADVASTRAFMEQLAILHHVGIRVVLVHGGGPQLTALADALAVPTRRIDGRRVTDEKTIDLTTMVLNGLINTRILAVCRELELDAVGVSGVDSGLIRAHKRPPVQIEGHADAVDFGFVGDIDSVDADVLRIQLDNGLMPVVSPLCASAGGALLNINADTVAAAIGAALHAEKLILCTDAGGILEDVSKPSSLISYIDLDGLERLRANGCFADGMLPKASAIETAIRCGVRRVHVISYRVPDSVLAEVFTNEGTGTLIVADVKALSTAEQDTAGR